MTMSDWEKRLNNFLSLIDREILHDADKFFAELAKAHAESEFEKYRVIQDYCMGEILTDFWNWKERIKI